MRDLWRTVVAALLACAMIGALAADFPDRPVRLLVPFPAGGNSDVVARIVAKSLSARLGQPVVVDNKPGAATAIGAMALISSAPDGYTLLLAGPSTLTINPAINPKLPYDPTRDMSFLGIVGSSEMILVANSDLGIASLQDLVSYARKQAAPLPYGTWGPGSLAHLTGELFASVVSVPLQAIPYKGAAPSLTDLAGGQIPLAVDTVSATAPLLRAGKVKGLFVFGPSRSKLLPGVPSIQELGYPAAVIGGWTGIVAPARLAADVQGRLTEAVHAAFHDEAVRAELLSYGVEPRYVGPAEFRAKVVSDIATLKALVRNLKISVE